MRTREWEISNENITCIWGEVYSVTTNDVYPNIWFVEAKHDYGVVIPVEIAKQLMIEHSFRFAEEHNGLLYYGSYATEIIKYEICRDYLKRSDLTDEQRRAAKNEMEDAIQWGHVFAEEYFGPFPAPIHAVNDEIYSTQLIFNGAFIVRTRNNAYLSVNNIIAEQELSLVAKAYGTIVDDYIFYYPNKCALAVFEISVFHKEIRSYITDTDALYATLWRDHKGYVLSYNEKISSLLETEDIVENLLSGLLGITEDSIIPIIECGPYDFFDFYKEESPGY